MKDSMDSSSMESEGESRHIPVDGLIPAHVSAGSARQPDWGFEARLGEGESPRRQTLGGGRNVLWRGSKGLAITQSL